MMDAADDRRLDATLALLLKAGTLLATTVIGVGLALQWFVAAPVGDGNASAAGKSVVAAGLAIFLLLPCLRVLVMLIVFIRGRDYRFGAVAALVLIIILVALSIGALAPAKASNATACPAMAEHRSIGGTAYHFRPAAAPGRRPARRRL